MKEHCLKSSVAMPLRSGLPDVGGVVPQVGVLGRNITDIPCLSLRPNLHNDKIKNKLHVKIVIAQKNTPLHIACRYKQPMNCVVNSLKRSENAKCLAGLKLRFIFRLSICIIVIVPVRISRLY